MKNTEKMKKGLALCCAISLVLSGCGKNEEVAKNDFDFKGYPIQTNEKLTYWQTLGTAISTVVDNAGKTHFAQQLQEKTGVEVEYIHPVAGQEDTSLSLLIASDQMPDIIESGWSTYNGGPTKNIKEQVIIELNDMMEEYAPNLTKYLKENPDVDRAAKTDNGEYYAFPFIRSDKRLLIAAGNMIRKDWLAELGLEIPKTVDDITNVLKAFRDKKGATAPLSMLPGNQTLFLANFSTAKDFYLQDGKVVYGPLTENYKTAIETMKMWYDEGLLDPNFVSIDQPGLAANVLNDKTGMVLAGGGGDLGTWLDSKKGQQFGMEGIPFVQIKEGVPVTFQYISPKYPGYGSAAITTSCKNPGLAMAWLDYGYGEEGRILYNFGTKDLSYTVDDEGNYKYTDEIFNNPDGLTVSQAMSKYFRASTMGPFIQSKEYIDQYYYRPAQQASLNAWFETYDTTVENSMPALMMTEEETDEYAEIMTEIEKYVNKMFTNFIMGTDSLDKYDEYVDTVKNLGIDRAIEINQAALDRYNSR